MSDADILSELERLAASNRYPFHMPGHKRRMAGLSNPYLYDITEIEGFDDLAEPKGVLRHLLDELADLYDAGEAFLSVNGSTGSNLTGIFAATEQHDEVLIAENCHRSVFHAAELRELTVHLIEPERYAPEAAGSSSWEVQPDEANGAAYGIPETAKKEMNAIAEAAVKGAVLPSAVAAAFAEHPAIRTVIITSPTYEGIISDIRAIADVTHAHGAKLFVDAAHGAHFSVGNTFLAENAAEGKPGASGTGTGNRGRKQDNTPFFPLDAIHLGADLQSVSLHKTLPMPGQSSLLLLPKQGGLVDSERVAHYWQIFMSSSPSYLLMAMVANGVRWLKDNGKEAFAAYRQRLEVFYREANTLRHLYILPPEGRDIGKIVVVLPEEKPITADSLAATLREQYAIDVELAADRYIIAMTSVMDCEEGFSRLTKALQEIDDSISARP